MMIPGRDQKRDKSDRNLVGLERPRPVSLVQKLNFAAKGTILVADVSRRTLSVVMHLDMSTSRRQNATPRHLRMTKAKLA